VGGLSLSGTSDAASLLDNNDAGATVTVASVGGGIKADSEEEIERLLAAAQEACIQVHQRYAAATFLACSTRRSYVA